MIANGASINAAESVHTTRFKQRILEYIPCLKESKHGRSILLTLDSEMGRALFEACRSTSQDDGIILARSANIIRRKLLSNDEFFDGDVSREKQTNSVPLSLINLIHLIVEGGNLERKKSENSLQIATNISQLIRFNSVKHRRKESVIHRRHSRNNEPPLPVLIGLLVHMKTRKKTLVNQLASEGLSITYDRVKTIQKAISNQLCLTYHNFGMVCPASLSKNVFTSGAIDNIDHNASSTTAKK